MFVDEVDEVPAGSTVIFSAHGVSPEVRAHAAQRDLDVIDATCPLVSKVHAEARRFAARTSTSCWSATRVTKRWTGTFGEAPSGCR